MNVIPAAPGTLVLTHDRANDIYDCYPVLAFHLDEDLPYARRVWIASDDNGVPWTLAEEAGTSPVGLHVLHPPFGLDAVLDYVASRATLNAEREFDLALRAGARYLRDGKPTPAVWHALRPKPADTWEADNDAAVAHIEGVNLQRRIAVYARSGDTRALLAMSAAEEDVWDGGFCLRMKELLQTGSAPVAKAG